MFTDSIWKIRSTFDTNTCRKRGVYFCGKHLLGALKYYLLKYLLYFFPKKGIEENNCFLLEIFSDYEYIFLPLLLISFFSFVFSLGVSIP